MSRQSVRGIAVVVAVLLAACVGPSAPRVAVWEPRPPIVWISDVAVLDVATGELTSGRDVLVAGGRIGAIEPAGATEPPDGAFLIPGAGATLLPGLVDMHGHVYANSAPIWVGGVPDSEANLRSYLYCGVTTIFDPADWSDDPYERRDRVARGELVGPRIVTAGPMHTAPEGHPIALVREFAPGWIAWYAAPRSGVAVDSVEEAEAAVARAAERGADAIKIAIDAIPLEAPRMRPEVARAMVEAARRRGLRTVAHIGTTEDAIAAAEAGVALWVHGVYKERIPDDRIAALAAYRIPMVATIEVFDSYARLRQGPREATALEHETVPGEVLEAFHAIPDDFDSGSLTSWQELNAQAMPARLDNVRRLHEAGVTILAGSDTQSGVFAGPGLHRELANLVKAGLTPAEAIRAATLDPARFLSASDAPDWGNIAVGQRADLLLVDGDPTADIAAVSEIRAVLKDGLPIDRTPIATR